MDGVVFGVAVTGLSELEVCVELVGFRWESRELSKDWDARMDAEEIRNSIRLLHLPCPHNIIICLCTYPSHDSTLVRRA